MEILDIKGLNKRYKNGRGIFDISLQIHGGQIFGFLGPNGSGKTTTLKSITGLIRKDSGEVIINGANIDDNFEEAMRSVGCMLESIVHYDIMSAYDNMRQVLRYYPNTETERIDELLDLVGLSEFKREKVAKFSLGMRQRLAIAEAMLSNPKLLIMDEPFNGLDIEGIIELRNIITALANENGVTFLISSHMAAEVEKLCTDIAIIKNGFLIHKGKVSEILELYPSIEDYFITQINLYKEAETV